MKIIKPQSLSLLTRPFEFKREYWLGVAVLAFLPIGHTAELLAETSMWPFLAEELPPDQPLDAAIPKARAEYLAVAHASAPGAVPTPRVDVGIQLGTLIKTLSVIGDRTMSRSHIDQPAPFTTMPVDWRHSFGGAGFADNPSGKGANPIEKTDGEIYEGANVTDPRLAEEELRNPASFAPVDQMWPARARLAGTYGDAWLKQDFPGFPRDIDWTFFNTAPADQWFPDGLAGDETYAFKNLHPTQPLLKGVLPGVAPRLFLVRKGEEEAGFEEVPLALTTVWFFPHRERLVLVHHGRARLAEEDGSDIARVVIGADRMGDLREAESFRAVMEKRGDRTQGAIHALRDSDLVPAAWLPADPAPAVGELSPYQQILGRSRRRIERERAVQVESLRARGLDPDKFGPPPLPPEQALPTLEELPGVILAARAEAEAAKAKAELEVATAKTTMAKQLAAAGLPDDEIQKRLEAKKQGPPAFSAAGLRLELTQQANAMRLFGIPTNAIEEKLADPDFDARLQMAEAANRNAYRLAAHEQDATANLSEERSAAIRQLVSSDPPGARALYDLHGADLRGLDLSGLDLSGVCLDSANLAGASFAGAKLAGAVFAHANMTQCVLDDADLTGANLGRALLAGASLRRAVLKKAVLKGADLTGAFLVGANLEGADMSDTIISGANFSDVRAPGMLAMKLSLRGLYAPGIVLTKAKFIECDLEGVDWTGASLEQAVFVQCNLVGLQLSGATMRKTVFVWQCNLTKINLSDADLTEANLREATLSQANLRNAILERADLSGADLTGALLTRVQAAGSSWVAANLRDADLRGGDFRQTNMARIDLRGANLAGVSVYEANLARAHLDVDTVRKDMLTTRMRYLPLYQAPESPSV